MQAIATHSTELARHSGWYQAWIDRQLPELRPWLLECLENFSPQEADNWQPGFMDLWKAVAGSLRSNSNSVTIDIIVSELVEKQVLKPNLNISINRQIVFAVVGWQTMLWKVDIGNNPPTLLCISDEMDGYAGQAAVNRFQDQLACRKPFPQLLMGFGILLPSPRYFAHEVDEKEQLSLRLITSISPKTLNIHLLSSIYTNFTIKWTDTLSHHLEFDHRRQQLYLFRFPSFCLANIDISSDRINCAIHACGEDDDKKGSQFWATRSNLEELLQETLRSYRLLFGQSKAARKQYRSLRPFLDLSLEDTLLHDLCRNKKCDLTAPYERQTYHLEEDFPMYKNRLVLLNNALAKEIPRTWKQLWNDKRDSAQWLTFWLVLIFRGIGIVLQFIQTVLQLASTVLGDR